MKFTNETTNNTELMDLFTVSLTAKAHTMAEKFRKQQTSPQRGKQVYLNTLAVYAVNYYLNCLGFDTDLANSESQDSIRLQLSDVADIKIKNLGHLECRPVLPNQDFVHIPVDVWSNRIGYLAVQMNESLKEATVLGFVKEVATEKLLIKELRSLEDFLKYMEKIVEKPIHLSQWFEDIFQTGWEMVESLLTPAEMELNFRFRGALTITKERGKLIELTRASVRDLLTLVLEIIPPDEEEKANIWVRVYPRGDRTYLPEELKLSILDENNKAVMYAQARGSEHLEFQFTGELNDFFKVMVALDDVSYTESFII